jgi:hypothetical protein
MKTYFILPFALLALAGCVKTADDTASSDQSTQPPLQRLVGTLSIVESYSVSDKSGAPFSSRKLTLDGKIDQLVRVSESSEGREGRLNFETQDNVPLTISGTVSETGQFAYDKPDDNMIVKGRGESSWSGKLNDLDLSIGRSALGKGDEISLRFQTPVTGKLTTKMTTRDGAIVESGPGATDFLISLMESVPDQPSQRVFKRDFGVMPALGATVPAEGLPKIMYEGLKANPGTAHLGLVTASNRDAWTYSGQKTYSKPKDETQWVETITLSLKLTKP